jgi:NADH-quinone oxidoreductase subunit J
VVFVMISLAILYVANEASFLGVVQVVVYTGAVMMLFLFVLMLIGVDSADSLVEAVRGQRLVAIGLSAGFGILLVAAIGTASVAPFIGAPDASRGTSPGTGTSTGLSTGTSTGLSTGGNENIRALAELIFVRYLWAFELTGALLITATLGAMVLAHRRPTAPVRGQREQSIERFKTGHATPLPAPGVYARHNAVDMPGRQADGTPSRLSVNRNLTPRLPESGRASPQLASEPSSRSGPRSSTSPRSSSGVDE